jgi:hypothetical protein
MQMCINKQHGLIALSPAVSQSARAQLTAHNPTVQGHQSSTTVVATCNRWRGSPMLYHKQVQDWSKKKQRTAVGCSIKAVI